MPVSAEAEKPVIGPLAHTAAPPERPKPAANGGGLIKKFINGLFGKKEAEEKKPSAPENRPGRPHQPNRGHGGGRPPHRPHHGGQRHERHERHAHPDRRPGGHGQSQDQNRPRPSQPPQASGGSGSGPSPGNEANTPQRERPEGVGARRHRHRGRRRGRGQEGRPPQTSQPLHEETRHAPTVAAGNAPKSFTETPSSASSWEKPSDQNDGWHAPSDEPSPKPEMIQIETHSDSAHDNKTK